MGTSKLVECCLEKMACKWLHFSEIVPTGCGGGSGGGWGGDIPLCLGSASLERPSPPPPVLLRV